MTFVCHSYSHFSNILYAVLLKPISFSHFLHIYICVNSFCLLADMYFLSHTGFAIFQILINYFLKYLIVY